MTTQQTTAAPTTVRVECKCKTCKVNASALALPLPLAANVPAALAAVLARTAQGRHGLVHMAHDPNRVTGAAARARTGVTAA